MEKFSVSINEKEYKVGYITDPDEAEEVVYLFCETYPEDYEHSIGLDIETAPLPEYADNGLAGLRPALSQICTIQFYFPKEEIIFVFNLLEMGLAIHELFGEFLSTRQFVSHHAQFEIAHFLQAGIVPEHIDCSMLIFRLLIHAIHESPASIKTTLQQLSKSAIKYIPDKEDQLSDWTKPLTQDQKNYAAIDAVLTSIGFEWCRDKINQYQLQSLFQVYDLNRRAQLGISQMSVNGIHLNSKLHKKLIKDWQEDVEQFREELDEILPEKLNIRSPKQLSEWITEELGQTDEGIDMLSDWPRSPKTGYLKCDNESLNLYGHLDIVAPLLKFKKTDKLVSTYGPSLRNCISPATGRVHSYFSQCYTATGRMSSSEPNLQNFPRGDARKIFSASKGYKLVGADFGQIEVRVAAYLSNEAKMIEAFDNGTDLYKQTASILLNKPISEITKQERQTQKAILLGSLFGLGAATMQRYARNSYGVDMTEEEAKESINGFREAYPDLRRWQLDTTGYAEQTLFTTTRGGKIRRLTKDSYYSKSLNTPVQGTAAEIVLLSIINVDKLIRKLYLETKLINVVHDELILEAPIDEVEQASEVLQVGMEQAFLRMFPDTTTRGLVDVGVGKTWADCKA